MAHIEKKEEKKLTKLEVQKRLEAARERDNELVTGIFRYIEHRGGTLRFRFKKYAQDDFKSYELVDGERYKLPRMVARHLNQNVHYIEYKRLDKELEGQSVQGGFNDGSISSNHRMQAQIKVPRCEFRSLEFMDDDLTPSPIIEVTRRA